MHSARILPAALMAALLGVALLGTPHLDAPASGLAAPGMPQAAHAQLEDEVYIGILMPLTGDLSSIGVQMHYASRMAVADFNEHLAEHNMEWRLAAVHKDTASSPAATLKLVEDLRSWGVDIVVGPAGSAQLFGVLEYMNHNGMVAISPASTSPALTVPGDAAFRTVPDDHNQGKALAALLDYSGVEAVVPISQNDPYQLGLVDAAAASFEARGGTTYDAILYGPGSGDYSDMERLADVVRAAIKTHGAAETAVLVMSYDEAVPILKAAAPHGVLSQVRWFGGEAIAQSTEISADPAASEFATTTGLTAVSLFLATGARADSVDERMPKLFGSVRTQFAYAAYDAVWLAGLSIMQTGGANATGVRAALPGVAESYSGGALESVEINEAGDLMRADYKIWTLSRGEWVLGATYDGQSDSVAELTGDAPGSSLPPAGGYISGMGQNQSHNPDPESTHVPSTITYGFEDPTIDGAPDWYAERVLIGVQSGFDAWADINDDFTFVRDDSRPQVLIRWIPYAPDHVGVACLDCLDDEPYIEVVLYSYDCKGDRIRHDLESVRNTVAHEFGHILGLGHHADETHLMHGDDGYVTIPFQTLGYQIPSTWDDWLVGEFAVYQERIQLEARLSDMEDDLNGIEATLDYMEAELDYMEAELDRMEAELDDMYEDMDQYADRYGTDYGEYVQFHSDHHFVTYDNMNDAYDRFYDDYYDFYDDYYDFYEEYIAFHDYDYTGLYDLNAAAIDEYNRLVDELNCMNGVADPDASQTCITKFRALPSGEIEQYDVCVDALPPITAPPTFTFP